MKTILIVDDGTVSALNAANFAMNIARHVNADLILAKFNSVKKTSPAKVLQLAGYDIADDDTGAPAIDILDLLKNKCSLNWDFVPVISELIIESDIEAQLVNYVNNNHVWLVIKGIPGLSDSDTGVKVQAMLNRITCPIMLVPEKFDGSGFEHIVYTADLRYCRLSVLKYLQNLAQAFHADLLLAHISAKGLPHMEHNYALAVFNDEISKRINYDRLYFANTKERDVPRAVDVMIHTMHADLLAVVHHRFHCEELRTEGSGTSLPTQISIPVIVFPY